jgi:DNA repair exonuclease SbcCD ATPase subunit
MAKGTPTARTRRFQEQQKSQEKKSANSSSSTTIGNDVFPSPPISPVTQAEGAQRAFSLARVLHQSLLHTATPGTHPHDLLINMAPVLFDCSEWYRESEARNIALQTQLDDINSKVITQAAEILQLQDLLKKSQEKSEFYRRQAVQADLVPPRRRCRLVSSDADNVLTPDELYQQLLWARDDIQVRDRALERLKVQHTQLQASFEQVLTSSSELLALHVTLLEQHLQLQARLKVSASAVTHYRKQFLEYRTKLDAQMQADSQLQETCAKYDKLTEQTSKEDSILKPLIDKVFQVPDYYRVIYGRNGSTIHLDVLETFLAPLFKCRPHLQPLHYKQCY